MADSARRQLAIELAAQGQRERSLLLWRDDVVETDDGLACLQALITGDLQRGNLALAGEYAAIHARLRWGDARGPRVHTPPFTLTVAKLVHDIDQLGYLQQVGAAGDELASIIDDYRRAADHLARRGDGAWLALDGCGAELGDLGDRLRDHYNRILHVRDAPRVRRALSDRWTGPELEGRYLGAPPGIVVVDDFLSPEALASVRAFCLESTVWSANRYAHGRLGAFFESGFNCPLLLQIAEEIAAAMPHVIGQRYPLRQLWAFKYGPTLPADASTHADFAAVSVNLWITPDDANLDAASGGLVVYDIDAPRTWSFERYQNTEWGELEPFLRQHHARTTAIAYRQNRAVIFNSDLFHGTAALSFRPSYEHRRINITMLFGDRSDDVHHPELAHRAPDHDAPSTSAWRSAALQRARRQR